MTVRTSPQSPDSSWRQLAFHGLKGLGVLMVAAFAVLVSWNMFAPAILDLDPIHFKEALGLVVFTTVVGWLAHARPRRHNRHVHDV